MIGTRLIAQGPGGGAGGGLGEPGDEQNEVEEGNGSGGGVTQEEADEENKRQDECAAKKFNERVTALGSRGNEVEHFSITWNRDGETVTTGVREATGRNGDLPRGSAVSSEDFNRLSRDNGGIPLSRITGFNHSHAADIYCDGMGLQLDQQRRDNQRPSENDWLFADVLTDGEIDHGLTLFVRDCEGMVRAYDYERNAQWRSGQLGTPPPISPTGCEEE